MLPLDVVILFFAAATALALAPGPDNVFVLTQSALYGKASGLAVTLGLCTGLIVHTVAVAVGVAAIFQASAVAFTALKFVGAAYLLYLAWGAFRAGQSDLSAGKAPGMSMSKLYRRGIVMNVTNPKVAIFFLAFLPQFADPERGSLAVQFLQLGAIFVIAALMVFSTLAWGAGFLGDWLRRTPQAQVIMNRVAGVIFVGMALKLATAQR